MAEEKDSNVKLTAKWQLDAAMLSRPVDLSTLVTMSQQNPEEFLVDETMEKMVDKLLNTENASLADKDTRLDVLTILANVAALPKRKAKEAVRDVIGNVSEWFEGYMKEQDCKRDDDDDENHDPELHKSMLLLLARAFNYRLKTEDVLELTDGDRRLALETIVGVLEEGETYSTELRQRQKPSTGKVAQWEHELVCHRYEKPLILQLCRLVRGFTHPATYFTGSGEELELYSVDNFSAEMDGLLDITLKSRIIEKLSIALYDCLFADLEEEEEEARDSNYRILLDESDHAAIVGIHTFMQNLYFYATHNTERYRQHMLADTLLVPRLILPYLDRCIYHTNLLNKRAETYNRALSMGEGKDDSAAPDPEDIETVANLALDHPALVQGIASSLRTLVIASFRAPPTRFVLGLLRRLNPTASMLRASRFCARHDYIFSLLCYLNVNMGALDLSRSFMQENSVVEVYYAHTLLHELASVHQKMTTEQQKKVLRRVVYSSALPVARDTPSYVAVMSLLHGGAGGQMDYLDGAAGSKDEDEEDFNAARAAAKQEALDRLEELKAQVAPELQVTEEEEKEEGNAFRLLGALPSFDRNAPEKDDATLIGMALEVHKKPRPNLELEAPAKQTQAKESKPVFRAADPSLPKEFTCSINGHLMKEPVRSPQGHVFERSTIELWLKMQGSVCPITHETLTIEELQPDEELQTKIMKWHIQRTTITQDSFITNEDDDIYDF
mmetsp:Transcript_23568/g.30565  ORF Transcript_23568/g.30565 Transcript_23568/m.30565 type:complete len:728 (-) Transcript_23568:351-2534(-)